MTRETDVTIGLIVEEGDYITFSSGSATHPDKIEWVVVPVSVPWKNDVQLLETDFVQAGAENGGDMGERRYYQARFEDQLTNSDDYWWVEVNFDEYPRGGLEIIDIEHSNHISYADFDPEDLKNYMHATL